VGYLLSVGKQWMNIEWVIFLVGISSFSFYQFWLGERKGIQVVEIGFMNSTLFFGIVKHIILVGETLH